MATNLKRIWKTWTLSKIVICSSIIIIPASLIYPICYLPDGVKQKNQANKVYNVQNSFTKTLEYCYEYKPKDLLFYTKLYDPFLNELYGTKFDQISYNNSINKIKNWDKTKKTEFLYTIKNIKFNEIEQTNFESISPSLKRTIEFLNTNNYEIYANFKVLMTCLMVLIPVSLWIAAFFTFVLFGIKRLRIIYCLIAFLLIYPPIFVVLLTLFV